MKFRARRVLSGVAVFVAGLAVLLAIFAPGGRATVVRLCPACFGFEKLADGVYVEASAGPAARADATAAVSGARARLARFFGAVQSAPVFFVCSNEACVRRTRASGGSALGMTVRGDTIVLSPRGIDPVIAAHEWTHAELRQRVGTWKFEQAWVPAWFDEGLAVTVAGDARYLGPAAAKYCPPGFSTAGLPGHGFDWGPRSGRDHMLYAAAACVVGHWLDTHAGADGLKVLIADLRNGDSFLQAYQRESL